jgi:long-chain fatty acid transport protein
MLIKRRKNTLAIALLGSLPMAANATNGDQVLGITATQWGMGGAVVAAPQDTGTVLTNPAGIAELGIEEVRFDLSPGFLNPPREVNGNESDSNLFFMPSGTAAFKVNDRLYFGLGMAAISGFGVDFPDAFPLPNDQQFVTTKGFFKLAPTVAYKVSDKLSLGGSINIGYQSLALSNPSFTFSQNQKFGFGVSLGAVYHINDKMQLGASWISKTNVSEHEFNTAAGKFELDMDMPQSFALGFAFHPLDGMLIELDAKWINFSATMGSVNISHPAGYTPGDFGLTVPTALNFGWDDQLVLALGVQKEINPKTTVRFGINYAEAPFDEEDVDNNLGSVAIPELHISLGMTRKLSDRISGSLSYTYAFENELTSNTGSGNTISIQQNIVYLQLSYAL